MSGSYSRWTSEIFCLIGSHDGVRAERIYATTRSNLVRALAAYRTGDANRNAEAIRILEAELPIYELNLSYYRARHALARLILAMALNKAEEKQLAQRHLTMARELLEEGSPRPGHAQVDKYNNVGYGTSGMWLEPLAILPEAENRIEGELSMLSKELMALRSQP